MKKPNAIAWSYSRYALHKECPLHFKMKHLDKHPLGVVQRNEAMARGDDIHKLLEAYVLKRLDEQKPPRLKVQNVVPWDGKRMIPTLNQIMEMRPSVESEFAFTRKWERCGWFDKETWVRVKVDIGYYPKPLENITLDYKSGKMKPEEHTEQLDLYALQRMLIEPDLTRVTTGPWYVDHEQQPRLMAVFEGGAKRHAKRLKDYWERVIGPLQRDKKFEATPSPRACRFCPFGKSKGGPCTKEAGGEYRRGVG